jgi:hypothetical protein
MASSIEELAATAMMHHGGDKRNVALKDVVPAKKLTVKDEPSWIHAGLTDFCDAVGISVSTLKLFITTIERAHDPSSSFSHVLLQHSGSETDQLYLRALWCQADGFELLDLKEKVYILPTTMVELLRMPEYLIETGQSERLVKKAILTEYQKFLYKVERKQMATLIKEKSLIAFMNSI